MKAGKAGTGSRFPRPETGACPVFHHSTRPRSAWYWRRVVEPDADTWQAALTRRVRTLLRTAPLHRAEAGRGQRGDRFDRQDLRALMLRALDVTIERMGLGTGARHEEVVDALRPLVCAADSTLSTTEADAVANAVIEALLNESTRRQAFAEPYLAVQDTGDHQNRVLRFHLMREQATDEGPPVLRVTTEGINLYAGMLEYPVEDAQIAEEAVLHSQIRRGRIADAVQTARRARLRSIEFEQKVVGFLETARRDVESIDWIATALDLIAAARDHVQERLHDEREMLRAVDRRLDVSAGKEAEQLASLGTTLRECEERHIRLHGRLIRANETYLDEQDRQAFRPKLAMPLPDMEAEVLRPAIASSTEALASRADAILGCLQAPRAPRVARLTMLVDRLLAPRHAETEAAFDLSERELEAVPEAPPLFSDLARERVETFIDHIASSTTLRTLLADARRHGLDDAEVHLLVLTVLSAFDPEGALAPLRAEPTGRALRSEGFFGDDLRVEVVQ